MSEWKQYKLGEIADVQTGPFGSQLHMCDYQNEGTPIITVEHLGDNRIIHNNLPLVGDEDKNRLSKYVLNEGDIVFSRVGSVDRRAYVSANENGWMFSGRCLRVRPSQEVDSKYLSYYFGLEDFKETIRRIAVGATMPSINTSILSNVVVTLPSLDTQRRIASILTSIDDKIDLLHRENATLEQMAETMFRQWFVEEAKEEWEEKPLGKCIKLIGGGTPKTSEERFWNGNVCWLSGGDIANNHKSFVSSSEKSISQDGLNNSSAKLLPENAMVVSARGTVGKYCLLSKPMAFSQSNYGILPTFEGCYFFTYLLVAYHIDELQSAAYGSVFDTITTKTFDGVSVKIPQNQNEIICFENKVTPYFEKIKSNNKQINTLIQTRDGLLPRLMSNEINI
ncbi:MAG: restriction endonuclease subunit S [Bacteroidales bacterium]|nr:restriction endonuclease subunit S [Bacteroidales bacterium]